MSAGTAAGERLGESLSYNRTLHTLLASNNNFSATAIVAICAGCVENQVGDLICILLCCIFTLFVRLLDILS
jgi:hypothetical protein